MADLKNVIANMSDTVRAQAESFAKANGISLEEAVSRQLNQEVSEADLDSVSGGVQAIEDNIEYADGSERNIEHND